MILRPNQIYLLRMGLNKTMCNGGGDSTSSTASSSSADTYTSNTDASVSTNTSSNWTANTTDTTTTDKRMALDDSLGISADASTVSMLNSGNKSSVSNSSSSSVDSHNTNYYSTDAGAVGLAMDLSKSVVTSNQQLAAKVIDAGQYLSDNGSDMLKANIAFAQHLSDSNATAEQAAMAQISQASSNAISTVAAIAAKPLNASDPQHILVIVGLVVVGAVLFSKMKV